MCDFATRGSSKTAARPASATYEARLATTANFGSLALEPLVALDVIQLVSAVLPNIVDQRGQPGQESRHETSAGKADSDPAGI